jgi:uncharacterized protein YcbK (DUF882 family)
LILVSLSAVARNAARLLVGGNSARISAAIIGLIASFSPNALESAAANGDTRTLFLYHSHSKEAITATFRVNGHYDGQVLEKLNWFLRDWRNDEPTKMDPRLFDTLWEAYRTADRNTGPDDPIVVVSAYRCPATNAMLRRRSRAVAEHSQHMLGKAMDTTMPGLSMEKLREIGMRMQRGGVGYYPSAGTPFVHLDVGGVRHWPRMNYDQLVRLFPDGKTVHIASNGKTLAGYEEARAEILARGGEAVSVAEANSGGVGGFFARLFGGGGGGEDEEEIRQSAPVARPTRVATARADEAAAAAANEQRRMLASAETNLPRGETYLAPADSSDQGRQAVAPAPQPAQPEPAIVKVSAKPAPLEEPARAAEAERVARTEASPAETASEQEPFAAAPLPPRRPEQLAALEAPLPPPRPPELAALPEIITKGSSFALRPGASASEPLAYAAPAEETAPPPLPPPRPAAAPLRAAALDKAEEARAIKAAAVQMAPARVDRAALQALVEATPTARAKTTAAGGFAPALRAASKPDLFVANLPQRGVQTRFGGKATQLSANSFSKKID